MPEGIGYLGDTVHDRLVRDIQEKEASLSRMLKTPFRHMVRWNRLYRGRRRDRRREDEKWRANVHVPYAYSGVETKAMALADIFNSADPLIQAEGVGEDDQLIAPKMEGLMTYTLDCNKHRGFNINMFREAGIQGTAAYAVRHARRSVKMRLAPSPSDWDEFSKRLEEADARSPVKAPDALMEPEAFENWRTTVNKAGSKVPEIPKSGETELVMYDGPLIERVSIFDLRFHPGIFEIQDQPVVMRRFVKTKRWVVENASDTDPRKPFSLKAVLSAMNGWDGRRFTAEQNEIADLLGISYEAENQGNVDKGEDCVILWEVWQPKSDLKYAIVMNDKAIINKRPTVMPYSHGQIAIGLLRNITHGGFAVGISELEMTESLYHEMDSLRNLRLDNITLRTIPIFKRLRQGGMPELRRLFRPGAIWDVSQMDGLGTMDMGQLDPAAFRELFEIKQDIDETNGTFGSLRGAPSTVGRVSATEAERRVSQALVRMKMSAVGAEEDFDQIPFQALAIWHQFTDGDIPFRVTGSRELFSTVSKSDLLQGLRINIRFRGATRLINRDMIVQQMLLFKDKYEKVLVPIEVRTLAKNTYQQMGLKGAEEIIRPEFTKMAQDSFMAQQAMAAQQAGMPPPTAGGMSGKVGMPTAPPPPPGTPGAAPGAPAPPPGVPAPPAEIPLDLAAQLSPGGGREDMGENVGGGGAWQGPPVIGGSI